MGTGTQRTKPNDDTATNLQGARLVCLSVDEIKLYDRNPRKTRNPEYDRIKASILAHGLEQPLIVTRRPGEKRYTVKAGGNTRLQILKDLYAASNDPSYTMLNCIAVGYQDESALLLGHLRENSLRGNLSFVDQAAAVCAVGEILADECNGKTLGLKKLQVALREQGFPISRCSLSYMRYTTDVLLSSMPVALTDGLGRHAVARIRRLHRSARKLWVSCGIGPEDEFDSIFAELCRRNDGPDWQFEPLRRAVENEIAEAADIGVQSVRMALDSTQCTRSPLPSPTTEGPNGKEELRPAKRSIAPTITSGNGAEKVATEPDLQHLDATFSFVTNEEERNNKSPRGNGATKSNPFLALRRRAHGLADGLASRLGLSALVLPMPDCGAGFLIADVPAHDMLGAAGSETNASIGTMWWQLVAFSDVANAPQELIRERLPEESALRQVLLSDDLELLFERVDIVSAAQIADRFWARLSQQDWQDWLYLAHTYREIRGKVIDTEWPLWRPVL